MTHISKIYRDIEVCGKLYISTQTFEKKSNLAQRSLGDEINANIGTLDKRIDASLRSFLR
jgi:hypothetical protein